jgi:hypothetical protein
MAKRLLVDNLGHLHELHLSRFDVLPRYIRNIVLLQQYVMIKQQGIYLMYIFHTSMFYVSIIKLPVYTWDKTKTPAQF